nr:hypothetical protein [Tanacetum cinerariifolium]
MPEWTDSEIARLLAISSPPASPLSPWYEVGESSSAAAARPAGDFRADYGFVAAVAERSCIPFPPLHLILSPPSPILSPAPPPSPIRSLGYRAAMIRLRDEATSISSPPSQLPFASRKEDRPEVTLPPQKRLGIALGPRRQTVISELPRIDHKRSTETLESRTALQGQIAALQRHVTALQA